MENFGTCSFFIQLSSGRWAALASEGWMVSILSFGMGVYPERFKHEPVRQATFDEIEEAENHQIFSMPPSDWGHDLEHDFYPEDSEIWGAAGF